ncbi:MAG: ACT domain-containing protein [Oscillospiraceae bacterium]
MQDFQKLIVVDSKVLPEIIIKVLDAKKMMARGEAKSSVDACKAVGISRSAYYKYRDCVFTYEEKLTRKIISLYIILKDEPGVLSSILTALYEMGANILTVNQNIPVDSVASVTVSLKLNSDSVEEYLIKQRLSELYGVVDIKLISGE